jgi:hypothetical protein
MSDSTDTVQPSSTPATDNSSSLTTPTPTICPICQDNFIENNVTHILPCDHVFHDACIKQWIDIRNLCPLCKKIADPSKPVHELKSTSDHLSEQYIRQILDHATNRRAVNFFGSALFEELLGGTINTGHIIGSAASRNLNELIDTPVISIVTSYLNDITDSLGSRISPLVISPRNNREYFPRIQSRNHQTATSRICNPVTLFTPLMPHPVHSSTTCKEYAWCENCFKTGCKHLYRKCSGCKRVRYCSTNCQHQNWNEHKKWCRNQSH